MGDRYAVELARSLADWTPALLSLGLLVIALLIRGSRSSPSSLEDDDEEGGGMMGFIFGGPGAKKPRLTVKSWNRVVDRYSLAVTKATKGGEEAMKLQSKLKTGYTEIEKKEVAAAAEAAKKSSAADGKDAKGEEKGEKEAPRRVWVLTFQSGRNDVTASGVKQLREEITAVVMAADPARDEVVLKLDSPGGTVTGYGLAGAQLLRIREAGLRLTIAIDEVAASGGYLMACTAHQIVCSPFAIIGSIGVVQELPVVFDRLKREGIQFETTTAGKFKRTLTPFKEPTEEDRRKNKENLEDILGVFKGFVHDSRPSVDIEAVATGDTWLGPLAKEQGLVDDLKTSDSLLLEHVREGRQVLLVSYNAATGNPLQRALTGAADTVAAALRGGVGGGGAVAAASGLAGAAVPPAFAEPPPPPMARSQQSSPWARYDDAWDAML